LQRYVVMMAASMPGTLLHRRQRWWLFATVRRSLQPAMDPRGDYDRRLGVSSER